MKTRIVAAVTVAAATLWLAGCDTELYGQSGSATPSDQTGYARVGEADSIPSESPGPTTSPTAAGGMPAEGAMLTTLDTDLGTIVADSAGRAVYQFDNDTQGAGTSACTGDCLANWPIVPGGPTPMPEGITGEVTTITGADGSPQLALNGWPLYYFAGDSASGDVNGQAVGGVWWVIGPDGEPIRD